MSKFALHDATGTVIHTGECPDGQEQYQTAMYPGLILFLGEAEQGDKVDLSTGAITKAAPVEPTYRELRASAYPRMADQLDALWHAMDRGEMQVAPEFYQMLKNVKRKFPNPDAIPETSL